MKKIIVLGLAILLIMLSFGCKNDASSTHTNTEENRENNLEKLHLDDFEPVEILFDKPEFDDSVAHELLKEINICSDQQRDELGRLITPCTPEFFHLFPLRENTPLKDGFILLVRANTGGIGLRRVLIFEREKETLVKVNGFVANLIGIHKNNQTNSDLLLRFIDKIDDSDVFYHCIFQWEKGHYVFKTVEAIHEPAGNFYGKVKESIKDSLSTEIFQILTNNKMIF